MLIKPKKVFMEPLIPSQLVRSPGNNQDSELVSQVRGGDSLVGQSPQVVESDAISGLVGQN